MLGHKRRRSVTNIAGDSCQELNDTKQEMKTTKAKQCLKGCDLQSRTKR